MGVYILIMIFSFSITIICLGGGMHSPSTVVCACFKCNKVTILLIKIGTHASAGYTHTLPVEK